jgi:hypothetical protein
MHAVKPWQLRISAGFARLASLGPRFWAFMAGLCCIGYGAYRISPACAFILVGALIVREATAE